MFAYKMIWVGMLMIFKAVSSELPPYHNVFESPSPCGGFELQHESFPERCFETCREFEKNDTVKCDCISCVANTTKEDFYQDFKCETWRFVHCGIVGTFLIMVISAAILFALGSFTIFIFCYFSIFTILGRKEKNAERVKIKSRSNKKRTNQIK